MFLNASERPAGDPGVIQVRRRVVGDYTADWRASRFDGGVEHFAAGELLGGV